MPQEARRGRGRGVGRGVVNTERWGSAPFPQPPSPISAAFPPPRREGCKEGHRPSLQIKNLLTRGRPPQAGQQKADSRTRGHHAPHLNRHPRIPQGGCKEGHRPSLPIKKSSPAAARRRRGNKKLIAAPAAARRRQGNKKLIAAPAATIPKPPPGHRNGNPPT